MDSLTWWRWLNRVHAPDYQKAKRGVARVLALASQHTSNQAAQAAEFMRAHAWGSQLSWP